MNEGEIIGLVCGLALVPLFVIYIYARRQFLTKTRDWDQRRPRFPAA